MISGQRVRITVLGHTYEGTVEIGSDNMRSLLLYLPDRAIILNGGLAVEHIAVLCEDDTLARYTDIMSNTPVALEWL